MDVNTPKTNRIYKARLFALIFSEKEECLKLYNAVNGTDYQDPEQLGINTLQDALGLCGVHGTRPGESENDGNRTGGGRGDRKLRPGRGNGGLSKEEQGGGEEHEYF